MLLSVTEALVATRQRNMINLQAELDSFQQIVQVSGRCGRGILPGEVILQTCYPQLEIFKHAAKHNFESFFK